MNVSWLFFGVALLVGALIRVQTGSNTRLKEALGEVSSSPGFFLIARF